MNRFLSERSETSKQELLKKVTLVKGDINQQPDTDAIVVTIGTDLEIEGTLLKSVIAAAGNDFDAFILENIFSPRAGDVFVVPGFDLPVRHVIFVILPPWKDGFDREHAYLLRAYRHAIETARSMFLRRISFPALGTGSRGYPVERAARLGIEGIMDRLDETFDEIRIVCDKRDTYMAFGRRLTQKGWKQQKSPPPKSLPVKEDEV